MMKITYVQAEAIGTAKMYKTLEKLQKRATEGEMVSNEEKKEALDILSNTIDKLLGRDINSDILQQAKKSVKYFEDSTFSAKDKYSSILSEMLNQKDV